MSFLPFKSLAPPRCITFVVAITFICSRTLQESEAFTFSPKLPIPHNHHAILQMSATSTSTVSPPIRIQKVNPLTYGSGFDTDEVMHVASYRNNRTSVPQMIAAQQAKRDSYDPVASALDGVKIGIGIGLAVGIITALNGEDGVSVSTGLKNFGVFGGTTAALLGYNNYSGNRVYVMEEKEAINRLTVDFVASLKIALDQGFVAQLEDPNDGNGKFKGCNGIVATLDCQLRNSKTEEAPDIEGYVKPKFYPGLPPHIHLKNMDVDTEMRRRGIAMQLIEAVADWGTSSTDAELLTLEVKDSNEVAIKLYEKCGFVVDEKRPTGLGLSFMYKPI